MVSAAGDFVLSQTESICPECLARIPAQRVMRGEDVYLRKTCPEHGEFSAIIWRGSPAFSSWARPKLPSHPETPLTGIDRGCPYDCGLCPDHRQHTCSVLLEVTASCDLGCPVCFADSGNHLAPDPDMETIAEGYRRILDTGGPFNIQLSGGEPCTRDDLPQIVALGRSLGFNFIQLNTNGLRLARDPEYAKRLKHAGLSTVFLQFDGTRDDIYQALRGRALADQKRNAIEHCGQSGIGVVLVPTLVPGINTDDIGAVIEFALRWAPVVRGVHFQPISYFGRYPMAPTNLQRITIPEVINAIATQTRSLVRRESFGPPGCENALCSFHGNFVIMADGQLIPLTAQAKAQDCCCTPPLVREGAARSREFVALHWTGPNQVPSEAIETDASREKASERPEVHLHSSLGAWDDFLDRARTHTFCISGMAFQDAWTLDLERLRDCCIHVMSPDGRLIPFCAYNLTDRLGRALYRTATMGIR